MQVIQKTNIDAPAQRVWEILRELDGVSHYIQAVKTSVHDAEIKYGVGAKRVCEIEGVGTISEKIIEWNEGKSYKYEVEGMPSIIRNACNTWEVKTEGNQCIVISTIDATTKFGVFGKMLENIVLKKRFSHAMKRGLAQLKYYIENDKAYAGSVEELVK